MTRTRNFPGRRNMRRLAALGRWRAQLKVAENPSENYKGAGVKYIKSQIEILENKTKNGGKKTTKKVGRNVGRINS